MSRFIRSAAIITLSASALASLPAMAADALNYNQISLRAEASQEVARDKMIVTLYTESQNADPAKLAAEITTTLNQALGQAREVKGVTLRQGSRNSYPIPYARNGGMMMKAAMADSAPTPEVEAGTSQVSMSADGVIEVLQ